MVHPSLAVRTEAWFLDEIVPLAGAVALRSPSSPLFRWGNLLVLDTPPAPGSRPAWEALFCSAFADLPAVRHATFAWCDEDGDLQAFVDAGYETDANVVRTAVADTLAPAPPAPSGFALRPARDEHDWRVIEEMQAANQEDAGDSAEAFRTHLRDRIAVYRAIDRGDRTGLRGSWYLATLDGVPAGCMGIYARDGLGRFQNVLVDGRFRRRGVARAMVHGVAREGVERFGAERLVIMADENTPADAIYAGLGFRPVERYVGACIKELPRGPKGHQEPAHGAGEKRRATSES